VLSLQAKALAALSSAPQTASQIAAAIGAKESAETIYLTLENLAADGRAKLAPAADPGDVAFTRV
jgi:glucose-6-phosphate isomerase